MARGPKRHLKRLNAPRHWMLDKLGGVWAPRPSTGPHKLRECLPLMVLLRNRLKYALTSKEVKYVLMQRLIKVDGKARTDKTYPSGFMGERRRLDSFCARAVAWVSVSGAAACGRVGDDARAPCAPLMGCMCYSWRLRAH